MPRCSYASRVATRPRGVRSRNPIWIRNGSYTSSSASCSSASAAASVFSPTGPPSYFSMMVRNNLRSSSSNPCASTYSSSSARIAVSRSILPAARTSAKSRTRRSSLFDRHTQHLSRARNDVPQLILRVELQPQQDPEPRPQRRAQQPRTRRRAHQRERLQFQRVRPRARSLPDDDVHLVVLERRVQLLLEHRLQPVNLVQKQHLLLAKVSENGS